MLHAELADLTAEVDQTLFEFEPPPGMAVITGGLLAEAGQTPASAALQAAKGAAGLAFEIGRRWLHRSDQTDPNDGTGSAGR